MFKRILRSSNLVIAMFLCLCVIMLLLTHETLMDVDPVIHDQVIIIVMALLVILAMEISMSRTYLKQRQELLDLNKLMMLICNSQRAIIDKLRQLNGGD